MFDTLQLVVVIETIQVPVPRLKIQTAQLGRVVYPRLMSDTLPFVVVMRDGLAAMLLESFASRRQTEVCRTSGR